MRDIVNYTYNLEKWNKGRNPLSTTQFFFAIIPEKRFSYWFPIQMPHKFLNGSRDPQLE
jgi:hypothetical protein